MQQRRDPVINFYRKWTDYKHGFGTSDSFWLGLDHVHRLTKLQPTTLRVELQRGERLQKKYIEYESFSVGDEDDQFRLHLGTAVRGRTSDYLPDELRNHTGPFCAKDSLNTFCRSEATHFRTGWWFSRKRIRVGVDLNANLESSIRQERVYWRGVSNIKTTMMMFRPSSFRAGKPVVSCDKTCPNGGTCRRNSYSRFECVCAPGFTDRHCSTRIIGRVDVGSDGLR